MSLFLAVVLLQDPGDRLLDALRASDASAARAALERLLEGDGRRAARVLAAALPRCRERMGALLDLHAAARSRAIEVDPDGLRLGLESDRQKKILVEQAKALVKETAGRALEAEKIYELLRAAFYGLKSRAAPAVAAEAARAGSWLLKCELYEGLGAMGAHDELAAALDREKDPVVVAAILHAGLTLRALDHLADPGWQVRLGALHALRGSTRAVGPIIEALPGPDARWRRTALESLARLTGLALPADSAVWREWWSVHREQIEAGRPFEGRPPPPAGPGRTTFYEVPLASTRLCILIDCSGSMREGGRFDTAKQEVRALVDGLPDGARINVLFFAGTVRAFVKGTRTLDAQARRDVLQFVDEQGYEAATDLYRGLEKALETVGSPESGRLREDGPDTIVVLSDGQATVGRLQDDELIARVIARRARYLRPAIHTVSLGDAPSFKLLAELTGGLHRVR
ncbi:MAG TPA: VWA domain-containing protein [Planctomycetota bacterium]|nr:VWA domain-containing protein [Planctomycetota bacterium]